MSPSRQVCWESVHAANVSVKVLSYPAHSEVEGLSLGYWISSCDLEDLFIFEPLAGCGGRG